jgi:serine protease Do
MRRIKDYGPSLIVLGATVGVLLAGPHAVRRISFAYTDARIVQASQRLEDNPILEQLSQAYRDLAVMVEPSVVHISTEQNFRDRWGQQARKASSGSGWVYDLDGHIVTNHHVIEDADRIEAQLHNGQTYPAEIVGSDPLTDIAVLKISPGELHPAARRGNGDVSVEQGELVFAFGSPFDFRFSMSSGVVSGKGRSVNVIKDNRGRAGYEYFIQVDAAINPGNSGGPLTDSRGRVIGMNTAIATGRRSGPGLEDGQFAGIGLAIPIEMIEPVVQQIIDKGQVEKGYLGLTVVDRDSLVGEELDLLNFRFGLLVAAVDDGHPAFAAGLRAGDVVTHVENERVTRHSQVVGLLDGYRGDERIALGVSSVSRSGRPLDRRDVMVPASSLLDRSGLTLLQVDDQVGELYDLLGYEAMGVRVAELTADGPALNAGLMRGDIITHVNDQPMTSVAQLRSVISSMMPGKIARVSVWRFSADRNRGRAVDVEVPLGRLDTMQLYGRLPEVPQRNGLPELGIRRMQNSSRELASRRGIEFHPGVVVLELTSGSPLADQLPAGSTIVEVMQEPVESVDELVSALGKHNLLPPFGVQVTAILPGGEVRQVRLQAEN